MKKIIKMENLDCANCAAKMEKGIKELPGVQDAKVSFMAQKLILETEDGADVDAILKEIVKVCRKIEPDCEVLI